MIPVIEINDETGDDMFYQRTPLYSLRGKVIGVHDGDTIRVRLDERFWFTPFEVMTVRIAGIDAPEMDDPRTDIRLTAEAAAKRLASLLGDGAVTLKRVRPDKYFRLNAAVCTVDEVDVGGELLKLGFARKYDGAGPKPW